MVNQVKFTLNGEEIEVDVQPHETLNQLLRDKLGLTGTKRGCDYGGCGSCTVTVDGDAVYSCMTLAMGLEGKNVITIEGLFSDRRLHPLQLNFIKYGGLQCGYCTPGIIMSTKALLEANPDASEADVRDALVGNLCRCTGYVKIIEAVMATAKEMKR